MNPYSNKGEVPEGKLRAYLYRVIFEAETRAGKAFDIVLIASILFSVAIVMLDSVAAFRKAHSDLLTTLEWVFTILFTFEYLLRLVVIKRPGQYAFSFFGVVDVLAVLPTYVSLVLPGGHYLLAIRALRLLRIFRVLKLAKYLREANELLDALRASRRKIAVFMFTVLTIVVICGSFMYVIEGGGERFYQHPTVCVLGGCYSDNRWLRRYFTTYRVWSDRSSHNYDPGLWDHCHSYRYCDCRAHESGFRAPIRPGVHLLREHTSFIKRTLLPRLRRSNGIHRGRIDSWRT